MPNSRNILVTGANGFVGKHLVEALLEEGNSFVYALDRKSSKPSLQSKDSSNFEFIPCDLDSESDFSFIPEDIDTVFHLASVIPRTEEITDQEVLDTNIKGTFNFLNHLKNHSKVKKIIYTSSISVYPLKQGGRLTEETSPEPENVYGTSKLAGEYLIRTMFSEVVCFILRYSSIYGFGQYPGTVLPIFLDKALKGEDITIHGRGQRKQNFIYIKDVVKALLLCLEAEEGDTLNIGSGEANSMKELAEEIISITASKSEVKFIDAEEGSSVDLDVSRAEKVLKFKNDYSLKDGLKEIYERIKK